MIYTRVQNWWKTRSTKRNDGSAPESLLPGWVTPTGKNDEQRLLQTLIDHLHVSEDTTNVQLLQYLLKEYHSMAPMMNTVRTLGKVRSRLLEFNVPYLRYDAAINRWWYWNDYSESGITEWKELEQESALSVGIVDDQTTVDEGEIQSTHNVERTHDTMEEHKHHTEKNDLEEEDPQPSSQSPPILAPPEEAHTHTNSLVPPAQEWLQSPPRLQNPYTGQVVQTPLPERLQKMVCSLQDHSDWYEPADNGPTALTVTTPMKTNRQPQRDEDDLIAPVVHIGEGMATATGTDNVERQCHINPLPDVSMGYSDTLMDPMSDLRRELETVRLDDHFTFIRVPATGEVGMVEKEFATMVRCSRYKSKIQQLACEHVANPEDTIVIAPCGFGKSMAFVYAALNSGGKVNIVIEPFNAITKSQLMELEYLSAYMDMEQLFTEEEAREKQVLSSYNRMQMIVNKSKVSTIAHSQSRDMSVTDFSPCR